MRSTHTVPALCMTTAVQHVDVCSSRAPMQAEEIMRTRSVSVALLVKYEVSTWTGMRCRCACSSGPRNVSPRHFCVGSRAFVRLRISWSLRAERRQRPGCISVLVTAMRTRTCRDASWELVSLRVSPTRSISAPHIRSVPHAAAHGECSACSAHEILKAMRSSGQLISI